MSHLDDITSSIVFPQRPQREREQPLNARVTQTAISAFSNAASAGPGAPVGSLGQRGITLEVSGPSCRHRPGHDCGHDHFDPYGPEFSDYASVHDWRTDGWTVQTAARPKAPVRHAHCIYCWWFGDLQEHYCDVVEMVTASTEG